MPKYVEKSTTNCGVTPVFQKHTLFNNAKFVGGYITNFSLQIMQTCIY